MSHGNQGPHRRRIYTRRRSCGCWVVIDGRRIVCGLPYEHVVQGRPHSWENLKKGKGS